MSTLAPPDLDDEFRSLSDTLPAHEPDPMRTLGWGVILWCHTWLVQPDGDRAGQPFRFTDAQIHFILWFYAVDDTGRWVHNRGAIRRAKGVGKTPFAAALALAEFLGPVRFAGFDSTSDMIGFEHLVGRPVPMPWVQIAATALDQTVNTMSMVVAMAPPGSRVRDRYRLDPGKTRIHIPGGGRLEIITASPHAAEGARTTFAICDETEYWFAANGGHGLFGVLGRNLAKTNGRLIETCNAFVPGQDSIAERTHTVHVYQVEGRATSRGLLYDALEAPSWVDPTDDDSLRAGLRVAYAEAPWVDLERIMVEYRDPGNEPAMAARFYLNHIIAGEDAWLDKQEWDACGPDLQYVHIGSVDPDHAPPLAPGEAITLGFDGSIREDATALVACRISDGHLTLLGCWEMPPGLTPDQRKRWQVDRTAVDAAVDSAFVVYDVIGFYADPAHWQDYLDRWQAEHGVTLRLKASRERPCEFWTSGGAAKRMVTVLERFEEAVRERVLSHDGNPTLTRHACNARRRYSRIGMTIAKEFPGSERKIDAVMAATLAYEARCDAVAAGLTGEDMFVPIRVY